MRILRSIFSWIILAFVTAGGLMYASVAFAQAPAIGGIEGKVIAILNGLIPLIGALNGLGLLAKYLPIKFLGYINNNLIPIGQTLLVFFGVLGGGTAAAQAGLFGDLAGYLTFGGKAAASMLITFVARQTFEAYLRPLAEKIGLKNNEALVGRD